jgi:putative aldouronate transport system permease protein
MKKKAIRMKSDEGFSVIALIIMSIFAVICVIPFLLIVSGSLSSEMAITVNGYRLLPQDFSLAAYSYLWARKATILRCLGLSVLVTGVGTLVSVLITSACAYPMSRPDFPLRNVLALFIFIPMIFTGGMTASYIMWSKYLGVRNTIWALLLPNALVGSMNILLVRNYYTMNIPYALVEASKMDGASEFFIFSRIIIPLSKPVLATIALFTGIGYWNNWINGMYYITDANYYTITIYLQKLLDNINLLKTSTLASEMGSINSAALPTNSLKMAVVIITILPIIFVYPFIQKQLIKGLVVGAVKG